MTNDLGSRCESTCSEIVVRFFWAKMLHGGALDYGSSKQPTHNTRRARAASAVCPQAKSVRLRPSPPVRCLRSSNAEHSALNRWVVSSSLTGGTSLIFEVWPNGKARRLGRWDWRFDSSHLDDGHGRREPCQAIVSIADATMRRRAGLPARRLKCDSGPLAGVVQQ